MKKVFLFFGLIMALVSQAQFPSTITSGNSSTLQKANGAFGSAIGYVFAGTYGDTTAANVSFIKNVPGIVIRIGDDLWIRNNAATAWIKIGAGSIPPLNQYQVGVGNASNQLSGSTDLQFQDGGLSVNNTGGNDGVINYGYSIMKHNFGVSNPASGYSTIYVDAADGHIKQKTSSGTVYDLTDNGSGSGTVNSGTQYRLGYYATTGTALSEAAAITGNRALVSDANGVPTHSATTATQLGYLSTTTSDVQTQINSKEATFTETTQEFTGATSLTLTLSNTLKSSKAVVVYYNGLAMDNTAFSASGTTVTLSGLTRETTDKIKVKYSY